MKNIILFLLLFSSAIAYSQVGIGTITPTETLDIDGSLRIRETFPGTATEIVKLGGLDVNGVFHEVQIGTNLVLKDGVLRAKTPFDHSFGSINFTGSAVDKDNLNLLLGPGQANEGKTIIKITKTNPNQNINIIRITGSGAYDGQQIWLLSLLDGNLRIMRGLETETEYTGTIRGQTSDNVLFKKYEVAHLVYDGAINRWYVMGANLRP